MKLSCSNVMLPGNSLTEKAELLRQWGYDAIAVFADYESWTPEKLRELKQLEGNTGIRPCEFVFSGPRYGFLMSENSAARTEARAMYRAAALVSAEIGAVTELEYCYGPMNPLPLFTPYQQMSAEQEDAFLTMYAQIADEIKGSNACVLLEDINRYESPYLNRLSDCVATVKKLNHPNAGVLADLFHMSIEESDMAKALREAAPYIRHVHLGDNNRLLPGRGMTDWAACMQALKDSGYTGCLNLECAADEAGIQQTVGFLRAYL